MYYPRRWPEFEAGVNEFLDASFAKSAIGEVPPKKGANTGTEDDTTMDDNMDELLHDSNVAFDDLLKLLKDTIPKINIPANFTQAKSIVRDLGLDYEKIPLCPNDCMLYWDTYKDDDTCHICNAYKWKETKDSQGNINERPKDGNLRHPIDGQSWKEFDLRYDDFAKQPRNVRSRLSSDGFNPFRTMSISHSTWHVMLVNYNLPPWMPMKPEYFMLSLLIPGPESLALTWTISDFPGYSMLSGWKTKGKFTCPCCNYKTISLYLKHSRKTCYMDHRRFLDAQHPWRRNKSAFNGQFEERLSPKPLSCVEALKEVSDFENLYGKKQKRKDDSTCPWKKRSIFFELTYWQFNSCRHNLDVMHIEENICDNLIRTLLDINGKTKDHSKARFDLLEMGIKERLHP
nr:hypothetical protein [Tanacetum cinerariifolium]